MDPIIQATNVSHHYGLQPSVTGLNLMLHHGEVMALLGTNGAGKTTTLRLLIGDLAPDSGNIIINQADLNQHPLKAKKQLGYLPDSAPLYEDLTVDEYLIFCAKFHGLSNHAARNRSQKVKQFCELNAVGRRLIKRLSKGYQQRIGIAQAIIHQPTAIILDEPTNGLDPTQIQEMRDLIIHLRNDAAVLLSTHQLNEVEQICDRVLMLKQGRTVMCENIDQLQHSSKVRMRFLCTVPTEELNKHELVERVMSVNPHTVEITSQTKLDTLKSSLLAQAQKNDWGLVEIYDVHETLEDIFISQVLRSSH